VSAQIFIQANDNQLVAAKVARFAMQTRGCAGARNIPITIMNVDELPLFTGFAGARYRCGGGIQKYDRRHVQSFTLSRFLPPELMSFAGRALVIDPDVLALADVGELLQLDLRGRALAACKREAGWETSVMLLDCAKLTHWRVADILMSFKTLRTDYLDLMWLRNEPNVLELSGVWNSHDKIGPGVKMLHMTRMSTQPWKTGLPIGATFPDVGPFLGFIARGPVRRFLGRPEPRFKAHPDPDVERTFMTLLKEAIAAGEVPKAELADAVTKNLMRPDIWERLA